MKPIRSCGRLDDGQSQRLYGPLIKAHQRHFILVRRAEAHPSCLTMLWMHFGALSLFLSLSCFVIEKNLIGFGNQESDMQRPSNLRAIRSRGIIQGENFWCVVVGEVVSSLSSA